MLINPFIVAIGLLSLGAPSPTADPPPTGANKPAAPNTRWFPVETMDKSLPSWLRFGGVYRARLEGQYNLKWGSTHDLYLLSRLRVNTTIQPAAWLLAFAELQDSRAILNNRFIPNAPSYQDSWDLRQAYLQLGNAKDSWVDLKIGRQVLAFGDERVLGPSDYSNTARTFDAAVLELHHAKAKASVFASSVVIEREGVIDHHYEGNNLYGVYGSLTDLIPHAALEPYVLWRVAPSNRILSGSAFPGKLSEVTTGVRLAGSLPQAFEYNVEMDWQTGSVGPRSISAWGGYWMAAKAFRTAAATPRLYIESNYASGTKDPKGDTWGTYDQIYPSSHDKIGFADQIGKRNLVQLRAGVEEKLAKGKLRVREAYMSFWLATIEDGLYSNSGTPLFAADPSAGARHVGQEIDLIGTWQIDRGLTAGLGYSRIFAGPFLKAVTAGRTYNYPFCYLEYRF